MALTAAAPAAAGPVPPPVFTMQQWHTMQPPHYFPSPLSFPVSYGSCAGVFRDELVSSSCGASALAPLSSLHGAAASGSLILGQVATMQDERIPVPLQPHPAQSIWQQQWTMLATQHVPRSGSQVFFNLAFGVRLTRRKAVSHVSLLNFRVLCVVCCSHHHFQNVRNALQQQYRKKLAETITREVRRQPACVDRYSAGELAAL
jgi:hypothetical protein